MHAGKQASLQASKHAGKEASMNASKKFSKQACMHASKKLSKQADKQGSKQASKLQVYKQTAGKQACDQTLRGHSVGAMPWRGLFIK